MRLLTEQLVLGERPERGFFAEGDGGGAAGGGGGGGAPAGGAPSSPAGGSASAPAGGAPAAAGNAPVAEDFTTEEALSNLPEGWQRYVKDLRADRRQLRARAQEAESTRDRLQAEKAENERKALAEQGKFKELFESEQKKNAELKARNDRIAIRGELRAAALAAGIIDDSLIELIPKDKIQVTESGDVAGIAEALEGFKAGKPHFFKGSQTTAAPAGAGGAGGGNAGAQPPRGPSGAPNPTPAGGDAANSGSVARLDKAAYQQRKAERIRALKGR